VMHLSTMFVLGTTTCDACVHPLRYDGTRIVKGLLIPILFIMLLSISWTAILLFVPWSLTPVQMDFGFAISCVLKSIYN
jgi:hypothetical protein